MLCVSCPLLLPLLSLTFPTFYVIDVFIHMFWLLASPELFSSSFVGFCDCFSLLLHLTQPLCLLATPCSEADVASTRPVALSHSCPVAMSINARVGLSRLPTCAACSAIYCSKLRQFLAVFTVTLVRMNSFGQLLLCSHCVRVVLCT